jgi:hypothetical protein
MVKMSIQDDFISIAFKYGDKNFFGLFKKDAPEALRARRPADRQTYVRKDR